MMPRRVGAGNGTRGHDEKEAIEMMRIVGWLNVIVGFFLLVLVLSGVFSAVLSDIASWNRFDSMGAKVVVSIAGVLAIASSVYLVLGHTQRDSR